MPASSGSANVTVALWTPQGRGAVATIKVCGDLGTMFDESASAVPFQAANGRRFLDQPIGRIVFGCWGTQPSEDVVVCRLSPRELEIHCHGGVSAARRILADWNSLGAATVDWSEQSVTTSGTLRADCQAALAQATTLRTASILLDQEVAWRNFATRIETLAQFGDWHTLDEVTTQAIEWAHVGRHLIEPFRVVLTGPPNVGKSALLNALVGYQRSVVFDQPGTTRDVVTVETAFDGWPVCLIDTAGLRDVATGLEAAGIELAHEQVARADLLLQVFDATAEPVISPLVDSKTIRVANKIDLVDEPRSSARHDIGAIAVSARTGAGMELLIAAISQRLVPEIPPDGTLIPMNERQRGWLQKLGVAIALESVEGIEHLAEEIRKRPAPCQIDSGPI